MPEGISLLDLPPAAIGEIEGGNFAYMVTPDGQPYKVDISQLVAKMQADAGVVGLKTHTEVIPPTAVQSGNTSPVTLSIQRQSGESIGIIGIPIFSMTFGGAAYASNTVVEVGYDGADVPMFTCDILGRTTSGAKQGIPVTTVGDAQSQVVNNADLVWKVQTGDPPSGDGLSTVTVFYIIQS
jgi:hypothetical protein